ncbi:ABC transporter substrate-binding protein [Sinorhizobium medicae]|uniref:ABC transporter substrate-binding protein n=1 Tax=Sinorhizobium medicae TaxID=110321 RepID=UPI000C7BD806|nr:ABC transporter substrate-binding protein [Sinorhizobium medicae]MDX0598673.1 ABC transporter substrate-binding protein [Sinorhizobium medicae]PLT87647.1 ABC transporter substrate-binding protein [Sinorhizobium medicae]
MQEFSRRAFLFSSTAAVLLPVMPMIALANSAKEPSMLEALAKTGSLPAVADRLPLNPMVVTPLDRVGTHGGDWNSAIVGGGSLSMLFRYQAYEPLLRYAPDWSGVVPNVAEHYESNADATEFTFRLRKGMKWSDGEPFTTEDILFWYEDIFNYEGLNDVGQNHLRAGGKKARFEAVDDVTFKVIFAAPNGLFPLRLAWANDDQTTRAPKHYLKQFHIKYNPNAEEEAKTKGASGWIQLFQREAGLVVDNEFFQNSQRPVIHAWKVAIAPGQSTDRAVAERNPYYWKVDTEGNQLPYLDRIVYQMVSDPQVLLLKAMQGEIDLMDQYIATPANRAVLYDSQEQGRFGFYTLTSTETNEMVFQLNLNHPNEVKRKLYNNKDFRAALSMALDRQAIIDTVFIGQGTISQPAVRADDPLYNERLATQYTQYDPNRANALLDKILPSKDSEGFRLDEGGKRVSIIFEIDQARATFLDIFQLALPMFRAVGVDVQMRSMDRSLWEVRVRQGIEYDATAHRFGGNGGIAAILDPRYFIPNTTEALYAKGWQLWYRDSQSQGAVEPPQPVRNALALYDRVLASADPDVQKKLMAEILEIAADQFYVFGICLPADSYGVVKNDMQNVPEAMPNSWGYPTPGPVNPETFFKV